MRPTILAVRAIGAEFAIRALRPTIIIGIILSIALHILGVWLTTQNAWWWILETLFIIGTFIFIVLTLIVVIILRKFAPEMTKTQKRAVRSFVDKLERAAEHVQTPQPVIIFYVVRDTIWPRQGSFIENISHDSKTLGPDFLSLRHDLDR